MKIHYACQSPEHGIARRQFLGTMAALGTGVVTGGLGMFSTPALAQELKSTQKRIVVFNMHGGLSQLESWDPKPGTDTGGPFLSIPTSVPGIHISELLPKTAKQMQHLCLVRGVNTAGVLNTLLERHLIKIVGRKQVVGRPFMYATTKEFLIRFGLNDLGDLPKVEDMAEALGIETPILVERTPSDEQLPLDEPDGEADVPSSEPPPGGSGGVVH